MPGILFPLFTHFTQTSYIAEKRRHPRLVCLRRAETLMGEIASITLVYLVFLAVIVMAVLYLERHW
ncbi:small membrane protein YldA [Enterobacter cancerogenus]|uniref:small membrane protein YldA n=1 Tax=Enterobacter cancerogenus TaxID=69218 RepID=UPI0036F3C3F4